MDFKLQVVNVCQKVGELSNSLEEEEAGLARRLQDQRVKSLKIIK